MKSVKVERGVCQSRQQRRFRSIRILESKEPVAKDERERAELKVRLQERNAALQHQLLHKDRLITELADKRVFLTRDKGFPSTLKQKLVYKLGRPDLPAKLRANEELFRKLKLPQDASKSLLNGRAAGESKRLRAEATAKLLDEVMRRLKAVEKETFEQAIAD